MQNRPNGSLQSAEVSVVQLLRPKCSKAAASPLCCKGKAGLLSRRPSRYLAPFHPSSKAGRTGGDGVSSPIFLQGTRLGKVVLWCLTIHGKVQITFPIPWWSSPGSVTLSLSYLTGFLQGENEHVGEDHMLWSTVAGSLGYISGKLQFFLQSHSVNSDLSSRRSQVSSLDWHARSLRLAYDQFTLGYWPVNTSISKLQPF